MCLYMSFCLSHITNNTSVNSVSENDFYSCTYLNQVLDLKILFICISIPR